MQKRKFDELISYFNRKVSEMEIGTSYKMELLGMVTALGYAHKKESEERKTGRWIYSNGKPATIGKSFGVICTLCNEESEYCTPYCPNCGADMRGESE